MQQPIARALLLVLTAFGLLMASLNADARAIRFDDDDGSGVWSEPETSGGLSTLVANLGFTFNFFGTSTASLTINANGSVSFGGALIAPFLDETQPLSFSYSTTNPGQTPDLGGLIPSAIRITWGSAADENQFQLAIFDLGNGDFAMEFNYAQIVNGSDAGSSIGYDNGAGASIDLLAELGAVLGLGGPLPFSEYNGIGEDGLDDQGFLDEIFVCADPARILACNNYNAVTGAFGSDGSLLPSTIGGVNYGQFFQSDPSFGAPSQGRYFFLVDNAGDPPPPPPPPPAPVPEPGTLWLLSIGLVGLAISRRRRRGASYIS